MAKETAKRQILDRLERLEGKETVYFSQLEWRDDYSEGDFIFSYILVGLFMLLVAYLMASYGHEGQITYTALTIVSIAVAYLTYYWVSKCITTRHYKLTGEVVDRIPE